MIPGAWSPGLPWLKDRIAVFEIYGAIMSSARVAEQERMLHALAADRRVRAVVIDVDSPGGSAVLSQHLHGAIVKVGQEKPVVAHIRNVGLSGGYMVASAARKIVALPTALVGSIGVIITRPVVRELMEKVGVRMFVSRVGQYKDMMQPWREPTAEEEEKLAELRDEYYDRFIELVAGARSLDPKRVREYATGEFFSGATAKEMGLIDELGDMDAALDMASEMGRVPRQVAYIRPRRALLERLLSPVGGALAERLLAEIESRLHGSVQYR
ncbi:MAG: signal peptide peptidase SppA [Chloroflexi bacterium]|nr:signal peptide peptidase SppA [Chloroflexota bacterium]